MISSSTSLSSFCHLTKRPTRTEKNTYITCEQKQPSVASTVKGPEGIKKSAAQKLGSFSDSQHVIVTSAWVKPRGTRRVLWILVLVYIYGMLLFSSFALAPELLCCWSFQWFYYKNPPQQKRVFKWLHQCGVSASLHRSNSAADALSSANAPASQANKLVLPPLEFSSCEPLNFKQCKHVMFHNWKFQDFSTLQLCTLRLQF